MLESEALLLIQSKYPGKYVHCFGFGHGPGGVEGWDVGIYDSEEDFEKDDDEGGDSRMFAREHVSS